VRAGKFEPRGSVVVETGAAPCYGCVTDGAFAREPGRNVVGRYDSVEVSGVTPETIRRSACETSAYVTRCAFGFGMRSDKFKPGKSGVVEPGSGKPVDVVALVALGRKVGGAVIQRAGAFIVEPVARVTGRIQAGEDTAGGNSVAGLALRGGVGADQREAIEMLADRLDCDAPSVNRVAILAVCAELAPMDVGMAGGAFLAGLCEDFTDVA